MTRGDRSEPRVVIVGAGFGGLAAAKALRGAAVRVTVVDRSNHHLFQPLLYQVATAALNPADIAAPIRRILRRASNTEVILADVVAIEPDARRVVLADGELRFDYLILATGVSHAYFGHDDWAAHAPGLKSIDDALTIRRRVLLAFEVAERATDAQTRSDWMTFAIVGGGPTGVELAGTLADVARKTLARDFRHIDPAQARVVLLEAGERLLDAYPADLSESTRRQLEKKGVEVRCRHRVTGIDADGVWLGEERLRTHTAIWAAGVAASPIARGLGVPLDRSGRVLARPDLTIPGYDHIYVIGDLMHVESEDGMVPGVAPAAMQAGVVAADNIRRTIDGKARQTFHYRDKGMLATIGRGAAVAKIGRLKMGGVLAWLLWLFVHIFFLIGFRNRVIVLMQWAWSYLTYDRGARLITGRTRGPLVAEAEAAPSMAEKVVTD